MTAVWEDLVSAALLGTERRPYPDGDLADAAAALWAYRQAGRRPRRLDPAGPSPAVPPPPPPDDRPLLPDGTLRSLASILGEPHLRPLLGEWLGLAQADGRRLPPEWLPPLLDLTADRDRPALDAAGGPRVAWLSAQRPEWAAGAPPTAGVLPVLPPDEAERAVLAWLAQVPFRDAAGRLAELPGPWSAAVTDAVMAGLGRLVASEDPADRAPAGRDALPRFALAADPSRAAAVAAAAGALEALPADRRPAARLFWGRALTSLNALVHFRQAMHQEFSDR